MLSPLCSVTLQGGLDEVQGNHRTRDVIDESGHAVTTVARATIDSRRIVEGFYSQNF